MRNKMRLGGSYHNLPVGLMCPKCNMIYTKRRMAKVFTQDFIKYTCKCEVEWGFAISKEIPPFWRKVLGKDR